MHKDRRSQMRLRRGHANLSQPLRKRKTYHPIQRRIPSVHRSSNCAQAGKAITTKVRLDYFYILMDLLTDLSFLQGRANDS